MASVTQARTTALASTATQRTDITKRFLRDTQAGQYGTTTATGADATELIDTTRLKSGALRREQFVGAWVRIPDVGSSGYHGEIRSIVDFFPQTGTIIVEPPFSAAVASSVDYEIYRLVHPQEILDNIKTFLEEEYFEPVFTMISELEDHDLESGATTSWGGTVSNATAAIATQQAGMNGLYSLAVTNTSAGGYAANSNAIYVLPGESYTLSALSKVASGSAGDSAQLALYDVTNSATLDTITHTELSAVRLYKSIFVPATCRQVQIRLGGSGTTTVTYWDDIVFFRDGDADISLPWWIQDDDYVKAVYRWIPTQTMGGSNPNVYTRELRGSRTHKWQAQADLFSGTNGFKLVSTTERMTYPLLMLAVRNQQNYDGSTPDSQYRYIDRGYAHAFLCDRYYQNMLGSTVGSTIAAKTMEKRATSWEKARRLAEYAHATRVEKYLTAPEPWASFRRD